MMSLRSRLAAGMAMILALLVVGGFATVAFERRTLIKQVDDRLFSVRTNAVNVATQEAAGTTVPVKSRRVLSEMYLGLLQSDWSVRTIFSPTTGPDAEPVLTPGGGYGSPRTVAVVGAGAPMRVVVVNGRAGLRVVIGKSLADVQAANRQLVRLLLALGALVIAAMGLVFWWIERLALAPINRVAAVARAIRAGEHTERVETFPDGTEAQDLGQAFNLLVDRNTHAEAMLRQFVADASHELRTPLATLGGYAELHAAGGLRDEAAVADAMRRIRQEAARMARLVDDLMLLAELDRSPVIERAPVDVSALLAGLVSDLHTLDAQREIGFSVTPGLVVPGDPDRLTQVFAGLLDNARKYTEPGTPIEIRATRATSVVEVTVIDHGEGLSTSDAARVFDRFYRADTARARPAGGSGLGLSIAHAIVAAHGGRLSVQPTPGGGATFVVVLPT